MNLSGSLGISIKSTASHIPFVRRTLKLNYNNNNNKSSSKCLSRPTMHSSRTTTLHTKLKLFLSLFSLWPLLCATSHRAHNIPVSMATSGLLSPLWRRMDRLMISLCKLNGQPLGSRAILLYCRLAGRSASQPFTITGCLLAAPNTIHHFCPSSSSAATRLKRRLFFKGLCSIDKKNKFIQYNSIQLMLYLNIYFHFRSGARTSFLAA